MVTIKEISFQLLEPLVYLSYEGDTIGLARYHVSRYTLPEAVQKTISMIKEESKDYPFRYYKILSDTEPVGFFVACEALLYSFGFKVAARTKEILMPWWNLMKEVTGDQFVCELYSNNTRAINFLKRRGMTVEGVDTSRKTIVLINKILQCQQQD